MKKRKLLTREYLEFLGIKDVFEDGTIIGSKGNPITPVDKGYGYSQMSFDRAELGKRIQLHHHHIVFAWFNGSLEPDQEVHHIDGNPRNNALSNLVALSREEHLKMHNKLNAPEKKCQMTKPRSFYEDKLANFEALYETAKKEHNANLCNSLRANISQTKARLRFWDNHKEEYFDYVKQTENENERLASKKQSVKERKVLEQYKRFFKQKGNKNMWKEMCQVINKWNSLTSMQKNHVFEVLKASFSLKEQFEF